MHTDPSMLSAALRGATFAASFAALFVGHQLADHWVQTDGQAAAKGQPGWRGRWACTRHVLTYTAVRTGSRAFVRMGAPREGHDDQPHLGTGAYALDLLCTTRRAVA